MGSRNKNRRRRKSRDSNGDWTSGQCVRAKRLWILRPHSRFLHYQLDRVWSTTQFILTRPIHRQQELNTVIERPPVPTRRGRFPQLSTSTAKLHNPSRWPAVQRINKLDANHHDINGLLFLFRLDRRDNAAVHVPRIAQKKGYAQVERSRDEMLILGIRLDRPLRRHHVVKPNRRQHTQWAGQRKQNNRYDREANLIRTKRTSCCTHRKAVMHG